MEDMTHEVSNGTILADPGLPNSEQELVKAKLTVQIYQILRDRKITQTEAAPLARHHPGSGFSADTLPAGVRGQADGMSDHARPGRGGDRKACRAPRGRPQVRQCAARLIPLPGRHGATRTGAASVTSSSSSKTCVPREAPSGPLRRLPLVWR
jgi:hypothetical protein